jgi:hypothetical protein
MDAVDFQFPAGAVLAFLYNPFERVTYARVLESLRKAAGPVRLAHLGPGHDALESCAFARLIAAGPGGIKLYAVGD